MSHDHVRKCDWMGEYSIETERRSAKNQSTSNQIPDTLTSETHTYAHNTLDNTSFERIEKNH